MFYLTTHSTHFIYGYMASDIWLRTILTVKKETRCSHMGYSYRLTARVHLYAPFNRQDSTCHSIWYTSGGALTGTRNSSNEKDRSDNPSHHERTLLTRSYISLQQSPKETNRKSQSSSNVFCEAIARKITQQTPLQGMVMVQNHSMCGRSEIEPRRWMIFVTQRSITI